MRVPAGLTLVAAVAAMGAPQAQAADVAVVPYPWSPRGGSAELVSVRAAPGERNDVRVSSDSDGAVVSDLGAPLVAGRGCTAEGEHAVRCARSTESGFEGIRETIVSLGDGPDRAVSVSGEITLDGGPGDDQLRSEGAATLDGGGGHDVLLGGPAPDTLRDGDGAYGAPVDADRIDGGPGGGDVVDYGMRRAGVRLDLRAAGEGGEPGEGDTVAGVEGALGGAGDDVIRGGPGGRLAGGAGDDRLEGSAGADDIDGGRGDDVLLGLGGDDDIRGGGGTDRLAAGAGDDRIASSGGATRIRCGRGADRVFEVGVRNRLAEGCERLGLRRGPTTDDIRTRLPLRSLRSSLIVVHPFPGCRRDGPGCTVATVRALGTRGRARGVIGRRRLVGDTAGLALSPRGQRLLRRRRVLRVRVTLRIGGDTGGFETVLRAAGAPQSSSAPAAPAKRRSAS